jgi:hypothetical protein
VEEGAQKTYLLKQEKTPEKTGRLVSFIAK